MTHSDTRGVLAVTLITFAGAVGVLIGQVEAPPALSPEEEASREREQEYAIVEGFREENGSVWNEQLERKREAKVAAEEVCREEETAQ